MRIYIATSWKNEKTATLITQLLQSDGHQVDSFSDPSNDRYSFHQSAMKTYAYANSPIHFLNDELPQREFFKDKAAIDRADMVLMIPPGGRTAILQVGYAKGRGKLLYVWGESSRGEIDLLNGFADAIIPIQQFELLQKMLLQQRHSPLIT
jgi:hypothetical protein